MATLHVRNVPDDLYSQIRNRAETSSRSLSAEVVVLLRGALEEKSPSVGELLTEISRRRWFSPAAAGAPDSTTLLREDRER
jgi:antitoxin FitA